MKNRLEYKYLVPLHCMDELRRDLLTYLEYDQYASGRPNNEYTVHSVYFDTVHYDCYYENWTASIPEKNSGSEGITGKRMNQKFFLR